MIGLEQREADAVFFVCNVQKLSQMKMSNSNPVLVDGIQLIQTESPQPIYAHLRFEDSNQLEETLQSLVKLCRTSLNSPELSNKQLNPNEIANVMRLISNLLPETSIDFMLNLKKLPSHEIQD